MVAIKPTLTVNNAAGVVDLEQILETIARADRSDEFVLRVSGAPQSVFLRDMWLALIVGAASQAATRFRLIAPGVKEWPDLEAKGFDDDETAALSLPYLLALQRNAEIVPEGSPDTPLSASLVRRHVSQRRGGLLGQGGKFRRLVEFDPEEPVATELGMHDNRARSIEDLTLKLMAKFEVGAISRGVAPVPAGSRKHLINFLRELHLNAYSYARADRGVRTLGFRKHLYKSDVALKWAADFPDLLEFVEAQGKGMLNIIEATVSDYGPGILDGFRRSEAAAAYADWPDDRLMDRLLHHQLSENLRDPNAGLGTVIALEAALKVGGFVTLRTGAHWFVMSARKDTQPIMRAVPGTHSAVRGTHWALLYPDVLPA